jgi:hypothetical protein
MNAKKEKKFRKAVKMEARIFYNELLRTKPRWMPKGIYSWFLNKILGV